MSNPEDKKQTKLMKKPDLIMPKIESNKILRLQDQTASDMVDNAKRIVAKMILMLQNQISPPSKFKEEVPQRLIAEDVFMLKELMKISFELEKREQKQSGDEDQISDDELLEKVNVLVLKRLKDKT